jgi:uncharacterized protein YbjT (DUF2867 family)
MNLLILGASGRTGLLVVEQALAAGHDVTALVRSPEKLTVHNSRLHVVAGQATDADDVARAMASAGALISVLGGGGSVILDSSRAIIEAAHRTGVKRVVVMSSFLVERDRMGALSWLITGLAGTSKIKDKQAGEELLRKSDLEWTIVYPGPLTDGSATGSVHVLPEGAKRRVSERISRADVAAWLVEAATDRQTGRRSVDITSGSAVVRTVSLSKALED